MLTNTGGSTGGNTLPLAANTAVTANNTRATEIARMVNGLEPNPNNYTISDMVAASKGETLPTDLAIANARSGNTSFNGRTGVSV